VDKLRASIVVACRNELRHISEFLDCVEAQDLPADQWEVIVADGMSNDGTREYLTEIALRNPRVRIIDNPQQIVSTGLNAAIRLARGEIILRMDVHSTYAPDYVRQCLTELEVSGAANVGGPARVIARTYRSRLFAAGFHSRFATGGASWHDVTFEGFSDTVPYGCWRKETLDAIGLFDEALVRNQDDELNLRILRAGGKIWQSPRIFSCYRSRTSVRDLWRQQFQYGFWKVAVIRKHRLPASLRHLIPGLFAASHAIAAIVVGCTWLLSGSAAAMLPLQAWLCVAAIYVAACAAAAIFDGRRAGWDVAPALPFIYGVYHFAYGLGFLTGIGHHALRRGRSQTQPAFAGLTR
jgi:succinoglycan biosynthesis protein ExoA